MSVIYLDHNATTPIAAEVRDAMAPYLDDRWGNPSSIHAIGRRARSGMDTAREQVAEFFGCDPMEVVFGAGGTECDNLAVRGVFFHAQARGKGNHIITTQVEHPAVLETVNALEKHHGARATYVSVDREGRLDLEELREAISGDTILISIMGANNETGNLYPVEKIGDIAKEAGVPFHCDAVQMAGKMPVSPRAMNADLVTISGHKIYGPKGVGALYVRRGVRLLPMMTGGHQERGRRAGTENVAAIVALGAACELARTRVNTDAEHYLALRNKLEQGVRDSIDEISINGDPAARVPNTLNVSFANVEGESLLMNLDLEGVAASSGSACASGSLDPSHVLVAMGVPNELIHGSVRFSIGRATTAADIDRVLEVLPPIIDRLRRLSPTGEYEEEAAAAPA